jgi:hypothetical protein
MAIYLTAKVTSGWAVVGWRSGGGVRVQVPRMAVYGAAASDPSASAVEIWPAARCRSSGIHKRRLLRRAAVGWSWGRVPATEWLAVPGPQKSIGDRPGAWTAAILVGTSTARHRAATRWAKSRQAPCPVSRVSIASVAGPLVSALVPDVLPCVGTDRLYPLEFVGQSTEVAAREAGHPVGRAVPAGSQRRDPLLGRHRLDRCRRVPGECRLVRDEQRARVGVE